MNRIRTTFFIIVLLGFIIENLDALKSQSSFRNGEKRRSKRQSNLLFPEYSKSPCNWNSASPCTKYLSDLNHNGFSLHSARKCAQKHQFFFNGAISLPALQNGGMCRPNTNLFTANAFSALALGHITLLQLATLNLFPVPSVDPDMLLDAGYINTFGQAGQTNLLTALGIQASLFGHILPSQLQTLSLYPLQSGLVTSDVLKQAGYLTSDCIPTALGLSALHIRYFTTNNFDSFGCQTSDSSQVTLPQLSLARYIYGALNILTPVGLAALQTGFFSRDIYERLGIFPFDLGDQTQSNDFNYQEQSQLRNVINDLAHVGYLQANNYLLTNAGYYAILSKYLTIENLRSLNVWPCPGAPSMSAFISAGYVTYSGYLTPLGYSLLHAQYYPVDWLSKLGIHLPDEYHIFHQALRYGGYFRSDYHTVHASFYTPPDANADAAQVKDSQYRVTSADQNADASQISAHRALPAGLNVDASQVPQSDSASVGSVPSSSDVGTFASEAE